MQKAIEREVRQMERALGKESGEEFGKQFEESAVKAVDKALGTTKAAAKKTGKEAADEYAGQFAEKFQSTMQRVNREMSRLVERNYKVDLELNDTKVRERFNNLRREIRDLSKAKIGVDVDAGPAMIQLERIEKELRGFQDRSVSLEVRTNLGAAIAEVEAFRKRIARDAAMEVEVEIKAERSLGLFEKTVRSRIQAALSHFPPIEFDADITPAQQKLMELRERMLALGDKTIGVDIKADKALRDMEAIRRALAVLATDETVNIQVRTDAAAAAGELLAIQALKNLVDKTEVDVEVDVDTGAAVGKLAAFRAAMLGVDHQGREAANGFRAFNIAVLAGASLLPGVVPVIGALAGGLALLGPLAVGAGAGLAVMGIGFSGVGDAVKALGKVQENAAKDAEAAAKRISAANRTLGDAQRSLQRAEETGARSVASASQQVSDARQNAARVAEQAAQRVASAVKNQRDAEEALVDAQQDVVRAQQRVTEAREEARDRLEDLRLSIEGGALAERRAVMELADAQREYESALRDPGATAAEREELLLSLQEEDLRLREIRLQNERLAEEQAEANRTGVEGSREVVAAQDGVSQAQDRVSDAQGRVQEAVAGVAEAVREGQRAQADAAQQISDAVAAQSQAQTDAARAVSDAQRNLAEAQADYATAVGETSASVQALEVAMGKLGPAGQEFAVFWSGLLPQFREMRDIVQAGMFPGLQEAISDILTSNGPMLRDFMGSMATVLGDMFRQFGDMMTSPQWMSIWRTFSEYAPIFMQQFGEVGMAMLTFFGELFKALAPYSERFGEALIRIVQSWGDWVADFSQTETFRDMMEWLFTNGPVIFEHVWSIVKAFGALFEALEPLGLLILGIVGNFADWISAMNPTVLGIIVTAILGLVVGFQLAAGAIAIVSGAFAILTTPISLIIFLIGAVVTGLIILYTQSETFRNIVDTVFRAVGAVISWVWDTLIRPVLDGMGWLFGKIADGMAWAWENVLRPAWDGLSAAAVWMWENVLQPIFSAIGVAWDGLVTGIQWVWENILNPVWEALKGAAQILFAFLTVVIFGPLAVAWKLLSEGFRIVYDGFLAPLWVAWQENFQALMDFLQPAFALLGEVWAGFLEGMKWIYDEILVPFIINPFKDAIEDLQLVFSSFVEAAGIIWGELRYQLAKPINFVIETILNKGLFGAFNWVIDTLGLSKDWKIDPWDPISVNGEIPRFAAGGRVPGYSPNDRADNIPAMLTAGEWVQPVSTVEYYGADVMEAIRKRRIPREAFQFLADGGPVYQQIFSAVKKKFPRARLNDGLRPGAQDLHGQGLAVDLGEEGFSGGSGRPYLAAMANTLYRTAKPYIAELIYTGSGDETPDVKNGQDLNYGASTNAGHRNHVHLAVRNLQAFLQAFGAGDGNFLTDAVGWVGGKLAGIWDSITGVFGSLKDSITGPVKDFFAKAGDNPMTKIVGAMPGKAVDWMWEKIKGSVTDLFSMFGPDDGNDAAVDAVVNNGQVQNVVKSVAARYGWDRGSEWDALSRLIQKESNWNPKAQNPTSTAYGLFQFLNSTWAGTGVSKTADPAGQAQAGLNYISSRYGTPSKALAFHNKNTWYSEGGQVGPATAKGSNDGAPTLYDTGGWLPPGVTTVLNATNRPEPILTGAQWDELVGSRGTDYDGERRGIRDLHIHEVQTDISEAIDTVNHWVRVYERGGRYVPTGSN